MEPLWTSSRWPASILSSPTPAPSCLSCQRRIQVASRWHWSRCSTQRCSQRPRLALSFGSAIFNFKLITSWSQEGCPSCKHPLFKQLHCKQKGAGLYHYLLWGKVLGHLLFYTDHELRQWNCAWLRPNMVQYMGQTKRPTYPKYVVT